MAIVFPWPQPSWFGRAKGSSLFGARCCCFVRRCQAIQYRLKSLVIMSRILPHSSLLSDACDLSKCSWNL